MMVDRSVESVPTKDRTGARVSRRPTRWLLTVGAVCFLAACGTDASSQVSIRGSSTSEGARPADNWQPFPDIWTAAPEGLKLEFDAAGCIDLLENGKSALATKLACDDTTMSTGPSAQRPFQLIGTLADRGVVLVALPASDVEVTGDIVRLDANGLMLAFPGAGEDVGLRNSISTCWLREGPEVTLECGD
jgi:hypothetical protein